jgi:signal transduction histidine kinase
MFSALLSRQQKEVYLVAPLLLLALIGWADVVTGYQATLSVFYIVPVVLSGWLGNRYTPFAVAALACVICSFADVAAGHQYFSAELHAWEIFTRCALFFTAAVAVVAAKDRQEQSRARLAALQRVQEMEHQLARITEYEQQRIGRELHDGLSQYLAAVSCAMTSLKLDIEKVGSASLAAKAAEIEALLGQSVDQARELARNLAPVHHKGPGLAAALQELAATTTRRAGIPCSFETMGEDAITKDSVATYLYRIAQEAIDNAVKHGKAHEIVVQLSANPAAVNLSISDDGIGFSQSEKNGHGTGIRVMEYRANIIGGELAVEEGANGGTTVSCAVLSGRAGDCPEN